MDQRTSRAARIMVGSVLALGLAGIGLSLDETVSAGDGVSLALAWGSPVLADEPIHQPDDGYCNCHH